MADINEDVSPLQEVAKAHYHLSERARRLQTYIVVLKAYAILGVIVAVGALAFFGFTLIKDKLTIEQQLTLAVAGAGAAIAAFSFFMLTFYKSTMEMRAKTVENAVYDHDLVRGWARFEEVARDLLVAKGVEFNSRSPREMVLALQRNELLPNEVASELMVALDVRNRVVHEKDAQPRSLVDAATNMISRANEIMTHRLMSIVEPRGRALNLGT